MKVALLAAIISVALAHTHDNNDVHGEHQHEHKKHHNNHLRGGKRSLTMPGHSHHFCGEAPVSKDFKPAVSHQDYYGPANEHIKRRRLAQVKKQTYGKTGSLGPHTCKDGKKVCEGGDCFMSAGDAKEAGLAGPMRVTFLLDLVNKTGDDLIAVKMCDKLGSHTPTYCGTSCGKIDCTKDDNLVTRSKFNNLVDRLTWVKEYLAKTFEIRRVQDDIVIQKNALRSYFHKDHISKQMLPPGLELTHSDTDLVILMTMDPPEKANVAGWALCLQEDQWGRCTVGRFNWVATTITDNPAIALAPNVKTSERATALHETMHVLGLKGQHSRSGSLFRDKWGCRQPDSFLFEDSPQSDGKKEDGFITKKVRHWKTPLVRKLAREQFGCDSLKGVPLEDVQMGWLAHWEARVMGSDVMSYGIGSGETYVSDITLAFFVDSGQYLVNFTCGSTHVGACGGGRLLEPTGEDEALAQRSLSSLAFASDNKNKVKKDEATKVNASLASSPGHLRWGRNEGCDFLHKKPTLSNWGKRYVCMKDKERGCTPDNRMSSACLLFEYGVKAVEGSKTASPTYPCDPSNGASSATCVRRSDKGLPDDYRYFTEKEANFGGYSEAMDYAPVRLGYWNCMDTRPALADTIKGVEGQEVDYGKAFEALETNIPDFGGQIRSSNSRCFQSSLTAFSEVINFDPTFPSYGLCYVANCYQKDYLQFGIKSALGGVKWYSCQGDVEKKITIPGYVGKFTCPNVTKFCEMETMSGKFFTENNQTVEWAIWGSAIGVIAILFIVFCFVKPARQHCAKCIKSSVGFNRPSKHARVEKTKCQKCLPKVLMALCVIWDLIGLGLVIVAVLIMSAPSIFKEFWESSSRQIYHLLFTGIFTAILASFGFAGARSDGPSLKICFYFYLVICVFVVTLIFTFSAVWLGALLEILFESVWDQIRVQFPAEMTGLTAKKALAQIKEAIEGNLHIVAPSIAFVWLSIIGGIIMSGVVLTCRNITGTLGFFTNVLLLAIGAGFLFIASYISNALSLTTELWVYSIPTLVPGIAMLSVGFMGILHLSKCVKTRGKICIMYLHLGLAGLATVGMIVLGIIFITQAKAIGDQIKELDESEMAKFLQAINTGGTWDEGTTTNLMVEGAKTYGIVCIVVSAVVIVTMITGAQVLAKTKRELKDCEIERAGQRMALSMRYKADGDQEWMQEDVEVLPEFNNSVQDMRLQQIQMHNAQPDPRLQQLEMANMQNIHVPMAQPVGHQVPVAQPVQQPNAHLNAFQSNDGNRI